LLTIAMPLPSEVERSWVRPDWTQKKGTTGQSSLSTKGKNARQKKVERKRSVLTSWATGLTDNFYRGGEEKEKIHLLAPTMRVSCHRPPWKFPPIFRKREDYLPPTRRLEKGLPGRSRYFSTEQWKGRETGQRKKVPHHLSGGEEKSLADHRYSGRWRGGGRAKKKEGHTTLLSDQKTITISKR